MGSFSVSFKTFSLKNMTMYDQQNAFFLDSIESYIFSEMSWVRSIVGLLGFLHNHGFVSSHMFSVCTEHNLHSVWSRLHTDPTVPTHILQKIKCSVYAIFEQMLLIFLDVADCLHLALGGSLDSFLLLWICKQASLGICIIHKNNATMRVKGASACSINT